MEGIQIDVTLLPSNSLFPLTVGVCNYYGANQNTIH